jgi:hypothetical protein
MHETLQSLSGWADLMQLVGFPLAILALLLGWGQLRKAARTARVQTLLALDDRLSDFEDIRAKLNKPEPHDVSPVRLRRYIAGFERIGYALRQREISLATVDQFYGSRFASLIDYPAALKIVRDPAGWPDFYYLWRSLRDYKGNKRELPPMPLSDACVWTPEGKPQGLSDSKRA